MRKISFELFIGIWNSFQNMATPNVHKNIAAWLAQQTRNMQKRLLLMAFRGCGKSTLVGLLCAWLLCHDPELRILIVAADEALAENMLRHIRHIIENHPLARTFLPKRRQLWAMDRLLIERKTISRDPSIRATGLHSNMTGSRADVIICDDVEVPNTSDTILKREKLRQALSELDFILVPGGMILYIGTPHAEDSLYKKDGFLSSYKRLEIPLDETIWPERFDAVTIEQIKTAVGPRIFASQMQLVPMALILNRLKLAQRRGSMWWGNSIEDICQKPMQFSCWNQNDPNYKKITAVDETDPQFSVCIRIARRAVGGVLPDHTFGADHYHAATITPNWAESRVPTITIGHHVFYQLEK